MDIIEHFLTKNPYSRPGKILKKIKGIVVHWTAMPDDTAEQIKFFFESRKDGGKGYGSTHYIINLDGEILQCIPLSEMAYHVGAKHYTNLALRNLSSYPNNCTIGIELTHPDWTGKFTNKTYNAAIMLCSYLLKKYNLNAVHHLFRHYDITTKECPRYFVRNANKWDDFILDVEDYQ